LERLSLREYCILHRARIAFSKSGLERLSLREYCSYLPTIAQEPFFVKVGANDGVTGDPCSDILLAESKWKGLLIEPVPYCFDRLKANFRDSQRFSFERVAIGEASGEATFYYVNSQARRSIPNLPDWYDQLGSFDKMHIVKHLNGVLTPFIVECTVEVLPLTLVLEKNGIRDIHLLHVDTEGHDYKVLKTLDFSRHAPTAIFVEHKHLPDKEIAELLLLFKKHRYSVYDCGGDYFAVNKKVQKRLRRTQLAQSH
jgi:FkbM family methyltransferase